MKSCLLFLSCLSCDLFENCASLKVSLKEVTSRLESHPVIPYASQMLRSLAYCEPKDIKVIIRFSTNKMESNNALRRAGLIDRKRGLYPTFYTLMSVGQKKLSVCQNNVAAFSCCCFRAVVAMYFPTKSHSPYRTAIFI